ncbi:pyroglutamyl-peptidase I [Xylophilus sp. GW821-FHT01B05]
MPPSSTHPRAPVLVTGFEPFGGALHNPSLQIAQALDGRRVAGRRVVGAVLPTVFGTAAKQLLALVEQHRPALVLCLGQAGGRAAMSFERVAINLDDAGIPDNAGAQPRDRPVLPGGPAAYFATVPVKAMHAALCAAGLPAELSSSAGSFVCNHVFYALLHALAAQPARVPAGFIHLPWLPEQGTPALPLAEMLRGAELAIGAALA